MQLVDMVDALLELLSRDASFRHFMLDGQSIILDDYVEVRPECRDELADFIKEGRVSVGPWYVLPDEALVSGESLIRNLMAGERAASPFGPVMEVGYLPDTFGHINQLPQVARGWGLKAVVITRGVPADAPCEFLWEGADGVPLLAINLRRSYGNALYLAPGENLVSRIQDLAESLGAYATTRYLLFTNGMDHHVAEEAVPEAIQQVNEAVADLEMVHGSLEQFVDAVKAADPTLEHRRGEMRDHEQHFLLPGVLSTRMWIKQRNASCQRLMERWAEPFSAWAHALGARDRRPFLQQAWRYLLQNHPHDSICGCSVDEVHEDMVPRFNWVEQIGNQIVRESLEVITDEALDKEGDPAFHIAVFNPESTSRTDLVRMSLEMPVEEDAFALHDAESGQAIPVDTTRREDQEDFSFTVDNKVTLWLLAEIARGDLVNKRIRSMSIRREKEDVYLDFLAAEVGGPDQEELSGFLEEVKALAESGDDLVFHFAMHYPPKVDVRFLAEDVPPMGYRMLTVVPVEQTETEDHSADEANVIANEFFEVDADPVDGTITLTDRASGQTLTGLNRFVDGGDAGDEYNYSPPQERDAFIDGPDEPPEIKVESSAVARTLRVRMTYRIPAELASDRRARSAEMVDLPIRTTLTLYPGVRRVDVETEVQNQSKDHRLRVHFPTGIEASEAWADAAFDVVSRPTGTPTHGQDWPEKPTGTWPQQGFVDVHDEHGLMVASDGLPEYEVLNDEGKSTIALTLLRCVGWLSRGDLATRAGNAGPTLPTPAAQCIGTYRYRYALIPHEGGWEEAFTEARAFLAPLGGATAWGAAPVSTTHRLVEVEPAEVVVSAVKQPEDGGGLVVRVFNPLPYAVDMQCELGLPFKTASLVNLREERDPEEHAATGARFDSPDHFEMKLRGKRIQTIRFT
jgi:alpha-mannosidase